jgi:hypothetical protein
MVIGFGVVGVFLSGLGTVGIPSGGSSKIGTSSTRTPSGLVIQLIH